MKEIKELEAWLDSLEKFNLPQYDNLTNIGLYMDQVTNYINSILNLLSVDEGTLTSSMVNNYVKQNIVPAPVKKKYNRNHLIHLLGICLIKHVLSISNLKTLVDTYEGFDEEKVYKLLGQSLDQEISNLLTDYRRKIKALERLDPEDKDKKIYLLGFAVELAIEAELKKIAAEKIVNIVTSENSKRKSPRFKKEAVKK